MNPLLPLFWIACRGFEAPLPVILTSELDVRVMVPGRGDALTILPKSQEGTTWARMPRSPR